MLLPVLGMFGSGNAAGMVLGLDYEYSPGGDDDMVNLRGASVGGREHQIVDDDIVFFLQLSQFFGNDTLTAFATADGLAATPPYDSPYRQGCQQESAQECGDDGPVCDQI